MKTIGIVGSRRRDDMSSMMACYQAFYETYEKGDRIVSGGCPLGADRFAEQIAKDKGITITIHYPDRSRPSPQRYYERNTLIAQDCDVLIAVVAFDRTGGTENTVGTALRLGKKVIYVE